MIMGAEIHLYSDTLAFTATEAISCDDRHRVGFYGDVMR